jgi:hypothetical protein
MPKVSITKNLVKVDSQSTKIELDLTIGTGPPGLAGADGAQGVSGIVAVTAPITNSGTTSSANIGLDQTAINITKSQVGLSNVDNTSDSSKISSGPIKDALDAKSNATHTHSVTGDATGTLGNGLTALTLKNTGTAGTYTKVTTDAQGRISSGTNLSASDVPSLTLSKITDAGTAAGKDVGSASDQVATGNHTHTVINNDLSLNGHILTNVGTPVADTDAARKIDVDNAAAGLNIKDPVQAATTTNISSFPPSGTQTIDGVSVTSTSGPSGVSARVLVKDQTTKSQNGIWVVGTPWIRASDATTWTTPTATAIKGAYTLVLGGTQANSGFLFNGAATGTIGSTDITFAKFTTVTNITAGYGLTKSGDKISAIGSSSINIDSSDGSSINVKIYPDNGLSIDGTYGVYVNRKTGGGILVDTNGIYIDSSIARTTGTSINGKSITLGTTNASALAASDVGAADTNLSNVTPATGRTALGLGNVNNTSDINKPVSTATQTALDTKQSTSAKDQPSGYPGLDSNGKLTSDKLPSNTYLNIDFLGHSYVAAQPLGFGDDSNPSKTGTPVGPTVISNRYSTQLAAMLNATEKNHAISGSVATSDDLTVGYPGGYGQALKWYPNGGDNRIYSINTGLNDLASYTTASWFTHSLRVMISRLRSNSVTEFTGLSGFSTVSSSVASGQSYQKTTSTRTITFSTSSGFAGGTVAIGFMVEDVANASAAITVTGASSQSASQSLISGTDTRSGVTCAVVKRITGLNAGVNNFSITLTVTSGSACVDYWQIESLTPGPLLVHKILKLSTYYPTYNVANRVNLTNINTWNTAITNLVTEFSGNIFLVDPNTYINKDATYIADDLVHPNDRGHAAIAQACYDVIAANSLNDNDVINIKTLKSILRNTSATGPKVESYFGNGYRQPEKNNPVFTFRTSSYDAGALFYPYGYHKGFWANANYSWGKTAGVPTLLESVNFRRSPDGKVNWSGLITKFLYTSGWDETLGNNPSYKGVFGSGLITGGGPFYKNDIVYYSTTSKYYQCKNTTTSGTLPTNTNYWNELTIVGSPFVNEITSFDPDSYASSTSVIDPATIVTRTLRGITYVALQSTSLSHDPSTGTTFWWPIKNGDNFISGTFGGNIWDYAQYAIVRRSGMNYISLTSTNSSALSSTSDWRPTIGYSETIATAPSEYLPPAGVQKSFNVLNESGFYSTIVVDSNGLHWYPYGLLFNSSATLPSNAIAAPPTVNTGWIDLSSISYYTD